MRWLSLLRRRRPVPSDVPPALWQTPVVLSVALGLATGALVWLGYVATREWKRGIDVLHERRATEAIALADAALSRDMTGAWSTLLWERRSTTTPRR